MLRTRRILGICLFRSHNKCPLGCYPESVVGRLAADHNSIAEFRSRAPEPGESTWVRLHRTKTSALGGAAQDLRTTHERPSNALIGTSRQYSVDATSAITRSFHPAVSAFSSRQQLAVPSDLGRIQRGPLHSGSRPLREQPQPPQFALVFCQKQGVLP